MGPNNEARLIRDVITAPLRIGIWATRLGVRLAEDVVAGAAAVTWKVIEGVLESDGQAVREHPQPPTSEVIVRREAPASSAPRPADGGPRAKPGASAVSAGPPAHVSEELQFVEAFAEPGAEEGAGAAVHIEAPWKGYSDMTADEVISRLAGATREELAAVELYERTHRARRTVLAAAEHSLRSAAAAARRPRESGDGESR